MLVAKGREKPRNARKDTKEKSGEPCLLFSPNSSFSCPFVTLVVSETTGVQMLETKGCRGIVMVSEIELWD